LQLEGVLPLSKVTELTSLSRDAVIKHYGHYLVRLSPSRLGMKLRYVLQICDGSARQQV
jgi:hypothetical protein